MKKIYILLLLFTSISSYAGPPDNPITPHEFVEGMGSGSWMVFDVDGGDRFNRIGYNPEIPAILKANGSNGGRLHLNLTKGNYDETLEFPKIYPEAVADINNMIDGFMAQDMYLVIHVTTADASLFNDLDDYTFALNQHLSLWGQLCDIVKNKSHKVAMCPVIEFHGFEKFKSKDYDGVIREYNNFLQESFNVFREKNPTRIISYKGYSASRINKRPWDLLNIPYGDKTDYYMVNGSGGSLYMFDKWIEYGRTSPMYTLEEMEQQIDDYFQPAINYTKEHKYSNGEDMALMIDHWDIEHDQDYPEDGYLSSVGIDVNTILDGTADSRTLKKYNHVVRYNDKLASEGITWDDPRSFSLKQRAANGRYFANKIEKLGFCGAANASIMTNYWVEGEAPGSGTSLYPASKGSLLEKHQEVGRTLHRKTKFNLVQNENAKASYYEILTNELEITSWKSDFEVLSKPQDDVLYEVTVSKTDKDIGSVKIETIPFNVTIDDKSKDLEVSCYAKSETASKFMFNIVVENSGPDEVINSSYIYIDDNFKKKSYTFKNIRSDANNIRIQLLVGSELGTYTFGLLDTITGTLSYHDRDISQIKIQNNMEISELQVNHPPSIDIYGMELYDVSGKLVAKTKLSKIKYNKDISLVIARILTSRGVVVNKILLK